MNTDQIQAVANNGEFDIVELLRLLCTLALHLAERVTALEQAQQSTPNLPPAADPIPSATAPTRKKAGA